MICLQSPRQPPTAARSLREHLEGTRCTSLQKQAGSSESHISGLRPEGIITMQRSVAMTEASPAHEEGEMRMGADASDAAPAIADRAQKTGERLALIKARAEEREARKAERAELRSRLSAKAAANDAADRASCLKVIERIERRAAANRSDRPELTAGERKRAARSRKKQPTGRDAAIKVGRRLVTDPNTIGKFIEVQVNRQLDVLTVEHSARPQRIDDVQFAVGRLLQDAWTGRGGDGHRRMETVARLGVLPDVGRDDGSLPTRDMEMLRSVFRGRAVAELDARIATVVGIAGLRLLRAILVDGHTFGTYAALTVGGGERGAGRIGERFRWLLSEVAVHLHSATGAEGQRIRATREMERSAS